MPVTADDDGELLDRYIRARDERAFAEIVRRYVSLVYSAAVRRVGDRHAAEDVTQAVFMILARRPAAARGPGGALSAWLLTAVRYAAANALKIERRRRKHEAIAASEAGATVGRGADSAAASSNPSDVIVWQEVARQLDDAVLKLPALDRRAILLRYFEQKPIRDVAAALNVTESAAKQRLSRSIDKLRRKLESRGAPLAIVGAAGLAPMLAAHAVRAAPASVVSSATAAAGGSAAAGATSTTIAKGAITMMNVTKVKVVAVVVAAASLLGTGTVLTVNSRSAARAQAPAASSPAAAVVQDKADARVRAAEAILTSLDQLNNMGQPPSAYLELKSAAQRRLAEARIDAATDQAGRVRAAEEHLKQCQAMRDIVKARWESGMGSNLEVQQAAYDIADAEYLLAKLQVGGGPRS